MEKLNLRETKLDQVIMNWKHSLNGKILTISTLNSVSSSTLKKIKYELFQKKKKESNCTFNSDIL